METYFLAAAVTVLITLGSIFDPLRRGPRCWRELWSCPLCLGFWVGGFSWAFRHLLPVWQDVDAPEKLWQFFTAGAATGCLALLFRKVVDCLDSHTKPLEKSP